MTTQTNTFTYGYVHYVTGPYNPAFGKAYPLSVYTPPHYGEHGRTHPVAYMFDGQNLFFDGGTFKGGWHCHEALDQMAHDGYDVPVVIGIHNVETRMEELSPYPFWGREPRGEAFLEWMLGPLAEWAQRELRIRTGPEHTMIGGASLGGLMAVYGFFRHPHRFGRVLAMSPSLIVDPWEITNLSPADSWPANRRLYLEAGRHEPRLMEGAGRFVDHLRGLGFRDGDDLHWEADPEGHHDESTWRWHLPNALRFLYR